LVKWHRLVLIYLVFQIALSAGQAYAQNAMTQTFNPLPEKKTPWSSELNFRAMRNTRPYAQALVGTDASLFYEIDQGHMLYGNMGYTQATTRDDQSLYRWGFQDATLGYFLKRWLEFSNGIRVDADVSLSLPTSPVSRRSGLNSSGAAGAIVRYPLTGAFFATSRHYYSLNWYEYETADKAGFTYNAPWAVSNSFGVGAVVKQVVGTIDYDLIHMKNYANVSINVQTVRAALNFPLTEKTRLSVFGRWRDRLLTNYAFLDPNQYLFGTNLAIYF
jgi:hypothetical protein